MNHSLKDFTDADLQAALKSPQYSMNRKVDISAEITRRMSSEFVTMRKASANTGGGNVFDITTGQNYIPR